MPQISAANTRMPQISVAYMSMTPVSPFENGRNEKIMFFIWSFIISKDRAQKQKETSHPAIQNLFQKRKAIAAIA